MSAVALLELEAACLTWLREHAVERQDGDLLVPTSQGAARALAAFVSKRLNPGHSCTCLQCCNARTVPRTAEATPVPVGCKLCGKPLAYAGAVFCGAACCAQYEGGQRRESLEDACLAWLREHALEQQDGDLLVPSSRGAARALAAFVERRLVRESPSPKEPR